MAMLMIVVVVVYDPNWAVMSVIKSHDLLLCFISFFLLQNALNE